MFLECKMFQFFGRNSKAERRLGRNINHQAFKLSKLDHMLQSNGRWHPPFAILESIEEYEQVPA